MLRYDFSEESLQHMTSYQHPCRPCRHWSQCNAFRRLCAGEDRLDDRGHCALYLHCRGERGEWHAAATFASYHHTAGAAFALKPPEQNGIPGVDTRAFVEAIQIEDEGLSLIERELQQHGLAHEMHMVTSVVPRLKLHPRLPMAISACPQDHHYQQQIEMFKRRPLKDVHLFALLLYTGTEAQGKIRKAMRARPDEPGEALSWQWTIRAIRHAVFKLAEDPPECLYHGLNGVKITGESVDDSIDSGTGAYWNLISGSSDIEVAKDFAAGAGGTVSDVSSVGAVINFSRSKYSVAADLGWISKFGYEKEWLMIPPTLKDFLAFPQLNLHMDDEEEEFEVWKGCTLSMLRGTFFRHH